MLPHLAEEGWAKMGGTGLVASQPWPDHDPALLVDDEVTIAVQVNGKLRDTLTVAKDIDKAALESQDCSVREDCVFFEIELLCSKMQ